MKDGTYTIDHRISKESETESELRPVTLDTGFYVSLAGFETKLLLAVTSEVTEVYITEGYTGLAKLNGAFIGIWTDETHRYFDLSQYVANREQAIQLGKERNQKAIWDIANNVAINLDAFPFIVERNGQRGISSLSRESAEKLIAGTLANETQTPFFSNIPKE